VTLGSDGIKSIDAIFSSKSFLVSDSAVVEKADMIKNNEFCCVFE
jgi:hypothetical protein